MAIGIELESRKPGVRGARGQGTQYIPEIPSGVGEAFGEALGRIPEAALNADFHSRIEAINRMDEANQMAEAELAFDRWQSQAMWGAGTPGKEPSASQPLLNGIAKASPQAQAAPTQGAEPQSLEAYRKTGDPLPRAMGLNGLLRMKGMAAADAAAMYDDASQTVIGDILGHLPPKTQMAMRSRLLAKRNASLAQLERFGFVQREAAVREKNAALMDARAAQNAEETAIAAQQAEAETQDRLKTLNKERETALASILTKEAWDKSPTNDHATYDDYLRCERYRISTEYERKVNELKAKEALDYAAIGTAYARKNALLREQRREAILTELGISEKELADPAHPEWAEAVEGRLAAYDAKAGAQFLGSMIDAGNLAFAKAALGDEERLISDYGIKDARVRSALREKLSQAETTVMRAQVQQSQLVKLQVAQVSELANDGVNYKYNLTAFEAERDAYLKAGDYASAAALIKAISERRKAEAEATALAKAREEEEANARSGIAYQDVSGEKMEALVHKIVTSNQSYFTYDIGLGKSFYVSKAALVRDIVWHRMPKLKSEAAKKAYYDSLGLADGGSRGDRAVARVVGSKALGFGWQAVKKETGAVREPKGDIYPVQSPEEFPANAALFTVDEDGRTVINEDALHGNLFVQENGAYRMLQKKEYATLMGTMSEYARNYAEMHPELNDDQLDEHIYGVFNELTRGVDFSDDVVFSGSFVNRMAAANAAVERMNVELSRRLSIIASPSNAQSIVNTSLSRETGLRPNKSYLQSVVFPEQ